MTKELVDLKNIGPGDTIHFRCGGKIPYVLSCDFDNAMRI